MLLLHAECRFAATLAARTYCLPPGSYALHIDAHSASVCEPLARRAPDAALLATTGSADERAVDVRDES